MGCIYPASTPTLPGQLVEHKLSWKAYVEGVDGTAAGQASTCRHPAPGTADGNHESLPGDPYLTWRNPFVYFHSLTDSPECGERNVGLEQLAPDPPAWKKSPALSYIVPNACHDGAETPCEPGQPAGLAASQPFLETVVPEIMASPAYREGGLIAITSAQAPQTGPKADASACCAPPTYPNLPAEAAPPTTNGPVKPTGGGEESACSSFPLTCRRPASTKPASTITSPCCMHREELPSVSPRLATPPNPPSSVSTPASTTFPLRRSIPRSSKAQSSRISRAVKMPSAIPTPVSVLSAHSGGS